MRALSSFEIGLMFWSSGDADQDIAFVRGFGLQAGQLGFGGELILNSMAEGWRTALAKNPDFTIQTAVCSYIGEDYTDIESVQETVGLVPQTTRAERIARTKAVARIAAELDITSVACHVGFIPHRADSTYLDMCDLVRDICDDLSKRQQNFTLETGQEPANALLAFMDDVGRPNLKINFDPANMILYGTGEPIDAVKVLGRHVISVHCKDGVSPAPDKPGSLGIERPLGSGQVDFPAFLKALRDAQYEGMLSIEREEPDAERRNTDIRHGVSFLRALSDGNVIANRRSPS
jgi:sugar phosphate isomerase/epimerase